MNKLLSALIASAFAIATTSVLADDAANRQKQEELAKMESVGNPNAPARGAAIVASAAATESQPPADASASARDLDQVISSGNPNAPMRGEAIAKSAATAEHQSMANAKAREQDLDKMISSGNPNAPARGEAIARSAQVMHG